MYYIHNVQDDICCIGITHELNDMVIIIRNRHKVFKGKPINTSRQVDAISWSTQTRVQFDKMFPLALKVCITKFFAVKVRTYN